MIIDEVVTEKNLVAYFLTHRVYERVSFHSEHVSVLWSTVLNFWLSDSRRPNHGKGNGRDNGRKKERKCSNPCEFVDSMSSVHALIMNGE